MDTIQTILNRHSVRKFTDQHITDDQLNTILAAAISGPSCVYAQDWEFIVVRDKETLGRMADCNGGPAEPARGCDVGILICGNLERAFPPAKDYWIIDGAIAGQNIVLAAEALGLGSVWLGVYPQMERVTNQQTCFGLPEHIVPHSLIAIGYPDASEPQRPRKPVPDCIHYEKW
jgi:nitroreductase